MATEVSVGELPTAEEEWEAWNVFWVANLPVPGQCIEVDGERRRDVEHKKSKGSSRDILIDQGLEPSDCTVKIRTTDGQTFRALYDFYLRYMDPERALTRLNVVPVSHPQCYARGIKMGYFYAAPVPKPTSNEGIRPYIHTFRFKIVGPKTQISGSGGSIKPQQLNKPVAANGPLFRVPGYIAQAGAVLALSATPGLLPGVSLVAASNLAGATPPTPPAAQPAVVLTPAQIQKLANADDATAKFITGLIGGRAP